MDNKMIGQTISHYRIIEKLGEGGMGVVYKAEDTKLRRSVALKFLPSNLIIDDDTKTRFINEAQTASALDHQNICTIFEIDESNDGQIFISMAYYGNETLKSKIAKGELTIDESIDIAIQVAQGLVKAHEKGIIHRDIKPANIIEQEDGTVKIIDFGLSKLLSDQTLTKTGTTKGTVAYMSPEQAQRKPVDHRTDIWSLGVLLYEMLTGERPFRGDIDQAVIYSIMNEQLEPLGSLLTGLPAELEKIVTRCLKKEPGKRYQNLDEVIAEMNQFRGTQSPATVKRVSATKRAGKPWRIRRMVTVGVLLSAIFLTIYFYSYRQEQPIDSSWKIKPLTASDIYEFTSTWSPDGSFIAYSAFVDNLDVYMMSRDGGKRIQLTDNPAIDIKPSWSPDGQQVVFLSNRDGAFYLWVINADGGNAHRLSEQPILLPPNFWSYSLKVRWAPDGKAIGFIAQGKEGRALWTVDSDGKNAQAILPGAHSFDWWQDSRHVIYNSVSTHELRVADLETGDEAVLFKGPLTEIFVSSDGRSVAFCYAVGHYNANMHQIHLELPEFPEGLPQPLGVLERLTNGESKWHVHNGAWSPDGKRIIYTRDTDEGDIYVIENYK